MEGTKFAPILVKIRNLTLLLNGMFSGEGRPVMSWEMRVKVAAGAARGIAYLHEDCKFIIILFSLNKKSSAAKKKSNYNYNYNYTLRI